MSDEDADGLDLHVFRRVQDLAGMDLLRELVDDLETETGEALETMTGGAQIGDLQQIRDSAHSVRSASAGLGALGLSEICTDLEMAARSDDLSTARDLIAAFEAARAAALSGLRTQLRG